MKILGYSGMDGSVEFARERGAHEGEERMVQGLDSAAALLENGKVIAAAAEERFSLEKHTNRFPVLAIRYCLKEAGIDLNGIDLIVHAFDYSPYKPLFQKYQPDLYRNVYAPELQSELWRKAFGGQFVPKRLSFLSHHLAHAASSFYPSGFDHALCLVVDGMGEISSLSLYEGQGTTLRPLYQVPVQDSLGLLYGLITRHIGFDFNADEYKVMGLAPYGDPARFAPLFDTLVEEKPNGQFSLRWDRWGGSPSDPYYRGVFEFLHQSVLPRQSEAELPDRPYQDLAAALQRKLEDVLLRMLEYWRVRTGLKRLCLSGGVALNCTFNGRLIESGLFDEIYIPPASADDGTALGVALAAGASAAPQTIQGYPLELPFYGPSAREDEIVASMKQFEHAFQASRLEDSELLADAAEALQRNKIIGWFQERMEFGPRALGNRSILANPGAPDIKARLNEVIKLREGFRPFAPAAIEEKASLYFDFRKAYPFYFMLATCAVNTSWREKLAGITHTDGSARLQLVSRRYNPKFHALISEFGKRSGHFCVINTSFNVRGQPIIADPATAIETFLRVKIDHLYLGNWRLTKNV